MDSQNNSPWQYNSGSGSDDAGVSEQPAPEQKQLTGGISWTASEYIGHEHGFSWFFLLLLSTAAVTVGVYFITKDYFAAAVIIIVGIISGVIANRKPHEITYEVSPKGLRVGEKTYSYSLFKSFSIIREGNVTSINLFPLKRFMPLVSAYFAPEEENNIVSALGEHLPYQEHQLDLVDRLARHLRF